MKHVLFVAALWLTACASQPTLPPAPALSDTAAISTVRDAFERQPAGLRPLRTEVDERAIRLSFDDGDRESSEAIYFSAITNVRVYEKKRIGVILEADGAAGRTERKLEFERAADASAFIAAVDQLRRRAQ